MRQASNDRKGSRAVALREVRERFETLLAERRYFGVRNFATDVLLEPHNPFQRTKRRPKKWVVAVGALGGLALALIYTFHIR